MTEETKTPRTRTAHLPRPRRARVQQREKARAWLSVERRRYVTEHHVTSATARVAMPVPEVPLVRDGRTIITDVVHVRWNIRRQAYATRIAVRRAAALQRLDVCINDIVAASAAVDKVISIGDVWGVHRAQVVEHMRVREYLRAEAAVENLPAVPRPPAALRPVDPETLRVPFPASRVYPVLATCTSPRRQSLAVRRAPGVADQLRHATARLEGTLSASERGVEAAEARSFARLQRMLAAQAEASIITTGKAVIAT